MLKTLSIFIVVGTGAALLPQAAMAQPKVHDHRKTEVKAPAPAPVVREHDHRKAKAVPDPKAAPAPAVHDHRKPAAAPTVHDHRTGAPAATPAPADHDRRTGPGMHHGKVGGRPDHMMDAPAPVAVEPNGRRERVAPGMRRRPQHWRNYEMPVVNRYWPAMGAAGTTVTIDGANFTPGLAVFIGDTQVTGATTTPTSVTFAVPEGTVEGLISLRGDRRTIAVGNFKVAQYDAKAERKKRRAERRKSAEADWKRRKKDISKNREERIQRLEEREAALAASREERRESRHAEIRAEFEAKFLADPNTVAELAMHAERLARLQRMERLAEANDDGKLMVRITVALADENDRHASRIITLKGAFGAQ